MKKKISCIEVLDNTENRRLWLKEADNRYKQYKKCKISARPAEDVLRDARLAIKNNSRNNRKGLPIMPDSKIDVSDIPELGPDFFANAILKLPKSKKKVG